MLYSVSLQNIFYTVHEKTERIGVNKKYIDIYNNSQDIKCYKDGWMSRNVITQWCKITACNGFLFIREALESFEL